MRNFGFKEECKLSLFGLGENWSLSEVSVLLFSYLELYFLLFKGKFFLPDSLQIPIFLNIIIYFWNFVVIFK